MKGTRHLIILGPIVIVLLLTGCIGLKNNINKDLQEDTTIGETNIEETSDDMDGSLINGDNPQLGVWSPDRKWVAVTNKVKSGNDTVLLEVCSSKKYEMHIFNFIKNNSKKYNYEINDDKPNDTNIDFLEWSPDSTKLLLSYGFLDDISNWQTGIIVYNLHNMTVEWLMKLNETKNGDLDVEKPDGFNWKVIGYGLEGGVST